MNINRLVIGTVVGGVTLFILGYVIWELLFADFFAANAGSAIGVMRDAQIIWAVGVGSLAYGALITLGIEGQSGTPTIVDGLKIGAVVGLLMWGGADFLLYGVMNLTNLTGTIADVVLEGVHGALGGAAIVGARKVAG